MILLQLFYEFFKTGLFAVGGGLATLPFLNDMADRTGWFTRAQLADMQVGKAGDDARQEGDDEQGGEHHPQGGHDAPHRAP